MLNEIQKSSARFDGGKPLANYRSHLRRTRSTLWSVRAGTPDTADSAVLEQACRVLDRQLAEIESDIAEANRIKRDWDQRISASAKALDTLPAASVADVIALAELDRDLGRPHALIADVEHCGWQLSAAGLRQEALSGLAHRCAAEPGPIDLHVEKLRAAMPAAAARHADLIRTITTLAVAEQIQRASQSERRP